MWSLTIEAHDSRQYLALNNQHLSYWKLWMPLWRFMGIIVFLYSIRLSCAIIQLDESRSQYFEHHSDDLCHGCKLRLVTGHALHVVTIYGPYLGTERRATLGKCMSWAAKMSETQCHQSYQRLNLPFNILKLNELIVSAMQVALSYDVEFSTTRVIHVTWGNVIVNNAAMLANARTSRWRGVLQFLGAERDATTYGEASSSCERGQILCGW